MTDINDETATPEVSDIAAVIEKLKSNPEIVTSIASALGANISPNAPSNESTHIDLPPQLSDRLPDIISTMAPLLSLGGKEHKASGTEADHRIALLCALKPYLNRERQEIVDYILKFSKIGDLLKKLK